MSESVEAAALVGSPRVDAEVEGRAGKYLTLVLGETEYGIEILKVREIIGMMEITQVPRTPELVRGVMNLRGKIIPVLDLRRIFGMEATPDADETRTIVVDTGGIEIGIVVDRVREVLDIGEDEIEDAPSFGLAVEADFVRGMGKKGGHVSILLDIDKVLSGCSTLSQELGAR